MSISDYIFDIFMKEVYESKFSIFLFYRKSKTKQESQEALKLGNSKFCDAVKKLFF